ncbi:hypothetical protein [Natrinema amylolyticum]|uniref:hypothetical protein n=1 Tax=Natrinema amylolyticum TaxID=2878679 RepID=UPI001CFC1829|nr:hypothetical protein [Natrinema amylolyticum]
MAARSWRLAVTHLAEYDIDPYEAVDALRAAGRLTDRDLEPVETVVALETDH